MTKTTSAHVAKSASENPSLKVNSDARTSLREQLMEMAEPAYRNFISPLMPGVEHVIGIRIPILRRMAREIAQGD